MANQNPFIPPVLGPPTIVGVQPVTFTNGVAPFRSPQPPNPAQISKQGEPLNNVVPPGPVPAFVPPTTFQLVDGSDP